MKDKNQITILSFITMILLVLMTGCDYNNPPGVPLLVSPDDNATNVSVGTQLSWQATVDPDGDAITYDVYLSTNSAPSILVNSGQTTTFSPTLSTNTTYYWQVIANDGNGGTTESDVWSFTTGFVDWLDATHGSFTDSRDNKTYSVVKIGEQVWFAENLAYEIPGKQITDITQWENNLAFDGWCYYDNNSSNKDVYGILYQWEAAMTAIPSGWHLPTEEEWDDLILYLGGESVAGGKLKETGTVHWDPPNTDATNESGFTALPGGVRDYDGEDEALGVFGIWWVNSTENEICGVKILVFEAGEIFGWGISQLGGSSVRCIQD